MSDIIKIDPSDPMQYTVKEILQKALKDIEEGIINPTYCVMVTDDGRYLAGVNGAHDTVGVLFEHSLGLLYEED